MRPRRSHSKSWHFWCAKSCTRENQLPSATAEGFFRIKSAIRWSAAIKVRDNHFIQTKARTVYSAVPETDGKRTVCW